MSNSWNHNVAIDFSYLYKITLYLSVTSSHRCVLHDDINHACFGLQEDRQKLEGQKRQSQLAQDKRAEELQQLEEQQFQEYANKVHYCHTPTNKIQRKSRYTLSTHNNAILVNMV